MLARRVLLVNHQPMYRSGLRRAVEGAGGFQVVGEAASGYLAMQEAERTRPNLLLIDADLPGMSGFAIAATLLHATSGRSAVMLAEEVDHATYDRSIASGAAGAISSRIGPDQLVRTLRRVAAAQPLFWEPEAPPARRHQIGRRRDPAPGLTLREIEVLDCVAQGFSNRDIAAALFVNEQTVKNHMTSIFRKLEVEDRVQALILSIKRGWVDFGGTG
jgi:DNA-binding NarL/FixJ family response regulator